MKVDIFNTENKYQVIYADPAWQFKNKNTGGTMNSSAESKYTVTSIEDMKALPVASIADEDLHFGYVVRRRNAAGSY